MKFAQYLDDAMVVVREMQGASLPEDNYDAVDSISPASSPTQRQSRLQRMFPFDSIAPPRKPIAPKAAQPLKSEASEEHDPARVRASARPAQAGVRFAELRVDTLAPPPTAVVRSSPTPSRLTAPSTPTRSTPSRLFSNVRLPLPSSGSQTHTPTTPSKLFSNALWRVGSNLYRAASRASAGGAPTAPPVPLPTLLEGMTQIQRLYFTKLDRELNKVEKFFCVRERESRALSEKMREQLAELSEHRASYDKAHLEGCEEWKLPFVSDDAAKALHAKVHKFMQFVTSVPSFFGPPRVALPETPAVVVEDTEKCAGPSRQGRARRSSRQRKKYDPHEYERARRRLSKALLEHYRGLEALNNYRILNVTGFRKAAKKFEKATKIPVIEPYMREKVAACGFAQGHELQALLRETEEQFSAHFSGGDKKMAVVKLRQPKAQTAHHLSTFFTGACLGLSIPVLASGIVQSFKPHVREQIPGWDSLLYIYATFLVPVVLALLVGINLAVWTWTRINYIFIFGEWD
ncbi:SPX domain-containing protein [Vararia minispora EC-137]|uniref:SPX domain-containing protein n=1 Tax=Vararia minispora EC-137 TaxID=1314806 RepID=A0ACB8QVF4_9AGAM|nr:SPX domain-containing protein [Vararia minispora EC-137]